MWRGVGQEIQTALLTVLRAESKPALVLPRCVGLAVLAGDQAAALGHPRAY